MLSLPDNTCFLADESSEMLAYTSDCRHFWVDSCEAAVENQKQQTMPVLEAAQNITPLWYYSLLTLINTDYWLSVVPVMGHWPVELQFVKYHTNSAVAVWLCKLMWISIQAVPTALKTRHWPSRDVIHYVQYMRRAMKEKLCPRMVVQSKVLGMNAVHIWCKHIAYSMHPQWI